MLLTLTIRFCVSCSVAKHSGIARGARRNASAAGLSIVRPFFAWCLARRVAFAEESLTIML